MADYVSGNMQNITLKFSKVKELTHHVEIHDIEHDVMSGELALYVVQRGIPIVKVTQLNDGSWSEVNTSIGKSEWNNDTSFLPR